MSGYLITGGTGSFGQAFTRHLLTTDVARVAILSRDEAKQAAMRQAFGDDSRLRFMVGDVRDRDRLYRAMQGVDVVIHAAALKRVEVAEVDADECVKTNVLGTMHVITAATDAQVRKVVLLSTDKACSPLNAYGASKLLAEKLMLAANAKRGESGPRFAVTRYGNVAGSRGSVIPLWREMRGRGEPLRITDPCHTRFWMEMHEAVELVAWTVQHMEGGELVVPKLPAYRVGDLAAAFGGPTEVVGARPGEKSAEAMVGADEYHEFDDAEPYLIRRPRGAPTVRLTGPFTSATTRLMPVEEIRRRLGRTA
jgi:UDP-N-acetylglucosamine 4,6-dehydratase